jgi:hypothetical protein
LHLSREETISSTGKAVQICFKAALETQGYDLKIYANYQTIQEWAYPNDGSPEYQIAGESGLWNITYIPEPSAAGLLACSAAAWLMKRKYLVRP